MEAEARKVYNTELFWVKMILKLGTGPQGYVISAKNVSNTGSAALLGGPWAAPGRAWGEPAAPGRAWGGLPRSLTGGAGP